MARLKLAILIGLLLLRPAAGAADDGAGLAVEAERAVAALLASGRQRIALIYPDTAAGRQGRDAVSAALARRGMGLVGLGTHRAGAEVTAGTAAHLRAAAAQRTLCVRAGADTPARVSVAGPSGAC